MQINFNISLDVDDLTELANEFPTMIHELLGEVGTEAVASVKAAAPVRSGKLRGEVIATAHPEDDSVVIESPTDYASYQEFGTRRRAAKPYFFPNVEAATTKLEAKYNEKINNRQKVNR
jgi:Bacteriophage HK97-gp10, putative tail-component